MQISSPEGIQSRRWPILAGFYAVAGGLVSFLGYLLDIPRLTDWALTGISIQPNASIAVMTAGAGLVCLSTGRRRMTEVLGGLVTLIGASVVFEYATRIELGIDSLLLFGRTWGLTGVLSPGRMGPPGAISWTLIGIALICAASPHNAARRTWALALALATTMIGSLSLIGYLYGANVLYTIPTATVIAFQTSTFVVAVSLGLVASVPERGFGRLVRDPGPAGVLVRRILPAVVMVPIALGFIRLAGEQFGFYDRPFGTAARTLTEIALLIGLLWWTAATIRAQTDRREEAEGERRRAERSLREGEQHFAQSLAAELADSQVLQRLSAEIVYETDVQSLYGDIVSAAVALGRSQFASMQMLNADRGELLLLASHGFTEEATRLWHIVRADSGCTCGIALRTATRVIVGDVTTSALITQEHREGYRQTGIRACQSTPLLSRSGRVIGMLSTHWDQPHDPAERELRLLDILARLAADLIERKSNELALMEADRRKDEFLATLAHELRNPLAPIRSAVDLMNVRMPANSELATARDVIDRQVDLLSRLLDDLLDVSRIARDRLELRKERLDVRGSVETAVELCRPLLDRAGHHLDVEVPSDALEVDADPVRLGQILGNLLHNAAKFTPPGGRIRIAAARDDVQGQQVVIKVTDSGIGIREDRLAGVFDLFSQVRDSVQHVPSGLGIGLYLVRRLVEMHGGRVDVMSAGEGCGTEFTVRLPAAESKTAAVPAVSRVAQDAAAPTPRRVLIVDDNVDAALLMAMLLELGGNQTHVAHDGIQAIRAAEQFKPEVILLDLGLPRMNGFEACRQIRTQPWGKNALLIAITGWGQSVDRQKSQEAGFDYHIVKPVDQQTLMSLLGEHRFRGIEA